MSISRFQNIHRIFEEEWEYVIWLRDCERSFEAEKCKRNTLSSSTWSSLALAPCCSPCTGWWPCLASSCDSKCKATVLAICKVIIICWIITIFQDIISNATCILCHYHHQHKGCHPPPDLQFSWTLFKKPLTPRLSVTTKFDKIMRKSVETMTNSP